MRVIPSFGHAKASSLNLVSVDLIPRLKVMTLRYYSSVLFESC